MTTGVPHHDPRSDAQLVDAINRGGSAGARAFDALYHRHRDWVANLAHRYTRDHALALDVMQETFIYLLGKFRSPGGLVLTARMTTFLYPVVRHIALRQRDKAARNQAGPESSTAHLESVPAPQAGPESSKVRVALAQVMASLPETHREVVLLRFVDGFTLEEVAAAMDIPVGTVKSRLHHALRQLREDPRVRDYFAPD